MAINTIRCIIGWIRITICIICIVAFNTTKIFNWYICQCFKSTVFLIVPSGFSFSCFVKTGFELPPSEGKTYPITKQIVKSKVIFLIIAPYF